MGPQSCRRISYHTGGSVRVTNCWRNPGIDTDSNEPGTSPTMQGEENSSLHKGHQRANTTHISSQSKANDVNHNFPNKVNSKHSNKKDHKGQHNLVSRPTQIKQTEEPKEHKRHEEILSVHIDDTQKSTYNAKVSSTEATALFDSGTTLSCISKCFYDCICRIEPSMVIDTNAGPAIVVTSTSDDKLINLGQYRLCIKLGKKTFEYYFCEVRGPKPQTLCLIFIYFNF